MLGRLGGDAEQAGNKVSLANGVALTEPSHSSLVDHVHRFDSLQRSPGTLERAVPLGQPEPFLYVSVVLLDDVVQVLALAKANAARQESFGLELFDSRWVRRILIDVHDPRGGIPRRLKGF